VQDAIALHRIVLVVSPITDINLITRWLEGQGRDYYILELNMRSAESRESFEQLRRVTRWRSLPQIFIDGEFIGGMREFFAAVQAQVKPAPTMDNPRMARRLDNPWAYRLGYAGLVPFFGLALLSLLGTEPQSEWGRQALLAYGAVILSFVGALHWARGLDAGNSVAAARTLIISVLPALLGWMALLLPTSTGLIVLACGFGALYMYDRQAWHLWPWFLSLRMHLTAGAISSLLLVWVGVLTLT
jgi:glutaredoxin